MKNIYVILNKINSIILFLLLGYSMMGQCPTAPATCNFTVSAGSNETSGFTVAANQTLCIQSGTYTGNINSVASTGIIYVAPGAVFNPASFNNFGGRFINCGTASLPGFNFDNNAGLARIENYGVATFTGTYGFNQASTWINGLTAKLTFNNSMTMNNVSFTNNGNVLMKSSFTMNTGTNTFINHDSLTALGPINLNASISNDGYLFAKGSEMTLNASGNITNSCYFVADGGFTYNGQDTLFVTGFTYVTGLNGSKFVIQGKAMNVTGEGFVQGINFSNNGTPVIGNGKFVFSGSTINQGPFGNDGLGLNFYDSGLPTGIFDVQNTAPHASVTKNFTATRDGSFVPNTCSNLIKCNTNTGDAGPDTAVCGSTADLKDANPGDPKYQKWGVVAGNPAAATIDPVTGVISGMTVAGDYYFTLYKFTNTSCQDIIKITVNVPPSSSLTVAGNTVCNSAANTTVTVNSAQAGVVYEAYKGATLLGSATGTGANLPITISVASLTVGANTISFKAKRTACATVDLTNTATVNVSPVQSPSATVTATSPVCSGGTSTVTIAATNGITYTVRDQSNTVVGTATAVSTGNLNITTSALTATGGPATYTFTVTASVASCSDVVLTTKPSVVVNPVQDPSVSVTATSPLCSGVTSTVTIAATKGITYTVKDQNNNTLGSATAASTGNLTITTSTLTATGSQATYTLTVTATVGGCSAVVLTNKPAVVVNPLLTPAVSLSATASTICAGTSVTVTATPTNGGTSPSYQWKVNGTNSGASTTSNTFTSSSLVNGDVVSVVLTSNAICATPTTANSTSNVTMTVNPLLTPSVTLSSSATTICAGTSVTVTATPTNGGAAPSYQWKVNGTNSGAATASNTFTSTTLANGDVVSVVLTSNATCATPTTANSSSNITMTVNPNITPSVNISAPATTICSGSSITFTATPTNGGTSPGYQWRVNGTNVNGATNATFTTSTLVNGDQVSVVLTSNATCRTSNTATSNVITMNIGTNLVPSVNISTANTVVCAGNSVTFSATVANGGTAPSFQWKINGVNAGAATSSSTFTRSNLADGDQVSVVLTSNETCVVTNTANSNTVTMTVNPVQPTNATVTATSPICSGGKSTVSIAATKGITYTVKDQNGNVLGTGTASASGNLDILTSVLTATTGPTVYTFTVTASIAGCSDVVLTSKPNVTVNPSQDPSAVVTATSPICSGGTASIVSVFGTNGITYTVKDQNGVSLGSGTATANGNLNITTSALTATSGPTTYTFTITASVAGCTSKDLTTKPTVLVNPSQDPAATVTATSPVCSGGTSVVTITATNGIKYTVKDQNNTVLGTGTATTSGPLNITTSALTATTGPTDYTFTITASVSGCNDVVLTQKPVVTVNPAQDPAVSVTATSPICSGGKSVVTIAATSGITYTVKDQNGNTLGSTKATASGNLNITTTVLTATTGPTTYTFTVTASVAGCSDVVLTTKPQVVVNPAQDIAAAVTATSPICSGGTSVVTITATNGITYNVKDQNNNILGSAKASANGSLNITTTVLTALTGPTTYTFTVTASVAGCSDVILTQKPQVVVNPAQDAAASVTATSPICSGGTSVVTIAATNGITYTVKDQNNNTLGSAKATANGSLNITTTALTATTGPTNYTFTVTASVAGCTDVVLTQKPVVVVNPAQSASATVTATSPICSGSSSVVTINATNGITYTVRDQNNNVLGSATATANGALNITTSVLTATTNPTNYTFTVVASVAGCSNVTLTAKPVVAVNKTPAQVTATGITICSNTDSATVTLAGVEKNVSYQAYLGATAVGNPVLGTLAQIRIANKAPLVSGLNVISIKGTVAGCTTVDMTDTANVVINILPTQRTFTATSPICEGTFTTVNLTSPQVGVKYTVIDQFNAASTSLSPVLSAIGTGNYALGGVGLHTLGIKADITGCATVNFPNTVNVQVNTGVKPVIVTGIPTLPICQNANNVTITITNPEPSVDYNIFTQNGTVETKLNTLPITSIDPSYTIANIPLDTNHYIIKATIGGCGTATVYSFSIVVDQNIDLATPKIDAGAANVCQGSTSSVTVKLKNAQAGIKYQLKDNGVNIGSVQLTSSANQTLLFGPFDLAVGQHIFTATGTNNGCGTATLSAKDTVTVSDSLNRNIALIEAGNGNVCLGSTSTINITISGTQKDVTYQLQDNGVNILAPKTALQNGDILPFGPISTLDTGRHVFTALITNAGCSTVEMKSSDVVVISDSLKSRNPKLEAGATDVCEGTLNVSKIILSNTQKGVNYTLFDNGTKIGTTVTASSNGGNIDFGSFTFSLGGHRLRVTAKNIGCDTVDLATTDSVNVNKKIDPTVPVLKADTNVVCSNGTAQLSLSKTQKGVTYTLFENGVVRDSAKATKDDDKLIFGPYTLTVGNHLFTLNAHNNACSDTILSNQTVKVNDKPNAKAFEVLLNGSILCSNAGLTVDVKISRNADYTYQVVDEFGGVNTNIGAVKSGNGDILSFGPFRNLEVGKHKIRVIEMVQNCLSDTSNSKDLTINNSIDTLTPVVSATSNVICENGSVSITIMKTSVGDVYRIKDNGKPVLDSLISQFDGDTLTFGPLFGLDTGNHVFTATTRNAGCGLFNLKDTANVRVNPIPNENTFVRNNSPICLGDEAIVRVDPVKNVTYTLYRGATLLDGPSVSVLKTKPSKAGQDTLYVVASVAGCVDVRVKPNQFITINQVPNTSLLSDTVSTCLGMGTTIPLYGTDAKWKYIASVQGTNTSIKKQGGGDISFALDAAMLSEGINKVSFTIDSTGTGCPNTAVDGVGLVYAIGNPNGLVGDSIVCETFSYDYHIPLVNGVIGYNFEVLPTGKSDTTILSMDSLRVKWGKGLTSGQVIAHPITTTAACNTYGDTLDVNIFVPYDKKAEIDLNKTIVCVGYQDTISIKKLSGGIPNLLIDPKIFIDSIVSPNGTEYTKYIIRYNEPGKVQHKYYINSPCTGKDSIMLDVVVLPNPIASAGSYPVLSMKDFPREVVLDGSGSSKGANGQFVYKWTMVPTGNIANSTSIMASFVPENTLTKVVLTVANSNGMCPMSDTAIIAVDLGIFIPNVFTPNGDGDHDNWVLENVNAFYPNVKVDIYSKWGTLVYHSDGYANPWDGNRNNQELPAATYYYVIDLKKPNFKPVAGSVTIIR